VLLAGLDVRPGQQYLAIASAGDNALAMLSRSPARVIALDLNPAQLACLALRVAAYRNLSHPELLELIGSTPSQRRPLLYQRCRAELSPAVRAFWDERPGLIAAGIGHAGKFERYFRLFRRWLLPLVHGPERVDRLLVGGSRVDRESFYTQEWDSWRWRLLFRLFFSRAVMGRLGRDPSFFRYVEGSVADRILARARDAVTRLDPTANPYLQWILTGHHRTALPYALRPENFEPIRANLHRLVWTEQSLEAFVAQYDGPPIDGFNLSDIFEYMAPAAYHRLLAHIWHISRPGGRLVYWNMLAPRRRPEALAEKLRPLADLARRLQRVDKAFFYSDFVVEEVI
jgi:S-adenosylmethionine-diacylglycerol 3-amino-3-carboxypropyl transferase